MGIIKHLSRLIHFEMLVAALNKSENTPFPKHHIRAYWTLHLWKNKVLACCIKLTWLFNLISSYLKIQISMVLYVRFIGCYSGLSGLQMARANQISPQKPISPCATPREIWLSAPVYVPKRNQILAFSCFPSRLSFQFPDRADRWI